MGIKFTCDSKGWDSVKEGQGFIFEHSIYIFCSMRKYVPKSQTSVDHGEVPHVIVSAFCLSTSTLSTLKVPNKIGLEIITLIKITKVNYELQTNATV